MWLNATLLKLPLKRTLVQYRTVSHTTRDTEKTWNLLKNKHELHDQLPTSGCPGWNAPNLIFGSTRNRNAWEASSAVAVSNIPHACDSSGFTYPQNIFLLKEKSLNKYKFISSYSSTTSSKRINFSSKIGSDNIKQSWNAFTIVLI